MVNIKRNKLKALAEVLKAFGDEKRMKIIKMLASNMDEILCVSDVAKKLAITQPAASQHIKVLKNIGVLEENRKGFRVFYTINIPVLNVYKKEIDELFRKAFEKCQQNFSCDECSYNTSCGA